MADTGSWKPIPFDSNATWDPLDFPGYKEKLKKAVNQTGLKEAVEIGVCQIGGISCCLAVMDFHFMGGSLGYQTAKKIEKLFLYALKKKLPVLFSAASGGARMQEGVFSLSAMALISRAATDFKDKNGFLMTLLTDPVSGGMTASLAMLGDIIIAEKDAFVGFAGPRVLKAAGYMIEEGFQSAETQFNSGFVDRVISRQLLKNEIVCLLEAGCWTAKGKRVKAKRARKSRLNIKEINKLLQFNPSGINTNKILCRERVRIARDYRRPNALYYIDHIFDSFIELHGDRYVGDDLALVGGIACFHGNPLVVVAQEKGDSPESAQKRNYGMVSPAGFRKALRLFMLAEHLSLPVVTFIDTPGADASLESERQGVGASIANLLAQRGRLHIPCCSLVIGQGGSGGALALMVGDAVYMQENAIFSVIMPEGCAEILFRDKSRGPEAADALKLDSYSLFQQGLITGVIPEPEGGSQFDPKGAAEILRNVLDAFLSD